MLSGPVSARATWIHEGDTGLLRFQAQGLCASCLSILNLPTNLGSVGKDQSSLSTMVLEERGLEVALVLRLLCGDSDALFCLPAGCKSRVRRCGHTGFLRLARAREHAVQACNRTRNELHRRHWKSEAMLHLSWFMLRSALARTNSISSRDCVHDH